MEERIMTNETVNIRKVDNGFIVNFTTTNTAVTPNTVTKENMVFTTPVQLATYLSAKLT